MDKKLQNKILCQMSQSELGRRLGKRPQTISVWFKGRVPAEWVLRTSETLAWRITPHELRPDLYPNADDGLPEEMAA